MMAMTRTAPLPPSGGPVPPDGPVPSLTKRVIELLRVEKDDLVVDLSCRDLESSRATPEAIAPGARTIAPSPFSERLAFLLLTSGVRMIQMDTLTFGRFPMRYAQVVLRNEFTRSKARLRRVLAAVFHHLDASGRVLVVDSAPSPDAPLFAAGLRRWSRRHRAPEVIAEQMREAGFAARVENVPCLRRVSAEDCYTWVESRDWPILESFDEVQLRRGLCELRARYGSQRMVEFTSRFDLVLGTKPGTLAS
jgi:hypothetical protein